MNTYDPMVDYQRNQYLAKQAMMNRQLQQMNYNQQFNPYPQPPSQQFIVRLVGNRDEAWNNPVDPGIIYLFLDTGTGKIYMKRLNMDSGRSEFFDYSVNDNSQPNQPNEEKPDFMSQINTRLTNIENSLGGLLNAKPISNVENVAKPNGDNAKTNV